MRILYCNKYNYQFSGTEAYLFEVMGLMRTQGQEVALFSMADGRGEPTAYDDFLVPPVDFKNPGRGVLKRVELGAHAIYSVGARKQLRKMIAAFRPDIAHVRNIYHHLSPSILWELRSQAVPILYHINDFKMLCPSYNMVAHGKACERCAGGQFRHVVTEGCYDGSLGAKLVLAAEAYVHGWGGTYSKCVDKFLAPSLFVKTKLVERGCDANKIHVLPHFQRIGPSQVTAVVPNSPILYFGRLSPEKGVADLIRAMRNLPQIKLQIAGDGPSRAQLHRLVSDLQLNNVEFLGHLERLKLDNLIAASTFTVLPSLAYETFGKSILESFAQGRAVVASDLGSRRELVKPGSNGLLFPPGDVNQLASTIAYLHQHPALATQMGAAGLEMCRNFQPETHYADLMKIYHQMTKPSIVEKTRARSKTSSALKVAFIGGRGVAAKYSGIETYYEEVGSRLVAEGHGVTVYCRKHFTPAVKEYKGMRVVRLPAIRSKGWETIAHTLLSTIHVTLGSHDIVHYHCLGPALFSFIPRLAGKKTVVTVQGLDWQRKKWGRIAAAVLRLGEVGALRFPNATMVVSRTLQQYFRQGYSAETEYVPNGTTLRRVRPAREILKLGLEPQNYILFLGRFSPEKNCDLLINAYEQLDTQTQLVFAGGSSHAKAYVETMRQHQSERIRILDWVSGDLLEELLTNAMLFVLPSDLEGLSLALLDAMGARVCALASGIPENLELLKGGAGYSFIPGDTADLGRMLQLLISDPEMRRAAVVKALEVVRDRYQWQQVVAEIERIYRATIAGTPRPKLVPALVLTAAEKVKASNSSPRAA